MCVVMMRGAPAQHQLFVPRLFQQGLLSAPGPGCELRPDVVLGYFAVPWPWWAYALLLLAYLGVLHAASFAAVLWTTSGRKAAAR